MHNRFDKAKIGSGLRPAAKQSVRGRTGNTRSIFLVGFMGAGKTTVGRALSRRLALPFEDLDDRIERRECKTVEQIFREYGETGFRKAETAALREVLAERASSIGVIALGGGAFVQPDNFALLESVAAHSVFLDAPVAELLRRCDSECKERPLRQDAKQFRELYEARRVAYMKAAVRIDTHGKDVEEIAAEVACSLGLE